MLLELAAIGFICHLNESERAAARGREAQRAAGRTNDLLEESLRIAQSAQYEAWRKEREERLAREDARKQEIARVRAESQERERFRQQTMTDARASRVKRLLEKKLLLEADGHNLILVEDGSGTDTPYLKFVAPFKPIKVSF